MCFKKGLSVDVLYLEIDDIIDDNLFCATQMLIYLVQYELIAFKE